MKTQIQKLGNTLAICIPDTFAEEVHLTRGTIVEISLIENKLVIDFPKEEQAEEQITLEQVLAGITAENIHHEIDGIGHRLGQHYNGFEN